MRHNEFNWDPVYCTELTVLSVLSVLNLVLATRLLTLEIMSKGGCTRKGCCKNKTWILICSIILYSSAFIRNFLMPTFVTNPVFRGLVFVNVLMRYIIYYLICMFYIKRV